MPAMNRHLSGRVRAALLALSACLASAAIARADSSTFRLYKVQQEVGKEEDSTTRTGAVTTIDTVFEYTDRGTKVPLKAQLQCADDYTPSAFTISGSTSRSSRLDIAIEVKGQTVSIRNGKTTRDSPVPPAFFTIAGYSPAILQESLIRYWERHGKPSKLATLPSGVVEIEYRGADAFTLSGGPATFHRYIVRGLVWGIESLWMDDRDQLAAIITREGELDHFEAVRDGYQSALNDFISAAGRDSAAALEEMTTRMKGRITGTLAITGATLIDGLGNPPVSPATVVTSGGKIIAAGPTAKVKIPSGATIIDAKGKYIIPGLWDMHAHYEQAEWGPIYLAAGVTTVRDVGNEFESITAIRDAVETGKGLGPRLLMAGIVDGDSPGAMGIQRVNTPADAAAWVKKYHDAGFRQMKIYSSVKPEMVKAVCEDAHALGMTVTGHIPRGMTVIDGVNAGMDQVNHVSYLMQYLLPQTGRGGGMPQRLEAMRALDMNSEAVHKLIDFLKQHGTVIDDTAALVELGTRAIDEPAAAKEPGIDKVAPELHEQFESMGGQGDTLAYRKATFEKEVELLGALHRAGVQIVAGTDQAVPGYSVYREIEIYVKAGFTPMEAIQAATIVPARVMGVASDSGTIEPGKRADFDILDRNPLADIHNIRTVHQVVANGTLYDPAPLWTSVGFR